MPTLLVATNLYSPLSVSFTFFRLSFLLSANKLILCRELQKIHLWSKKMLVQEHHLHHLKRLHLTLASMSDSVGVR